MPRFRCALRTLLVAAINTQTSLMAQPWAPGQGPPPGLNVPTAAEAQKLEQLRLNGAEQGLRERYLHQAHSLLHRFWGSQEQPKLLFAGDRAEGCGVQHVAHPMAY
jgi:hypothetical protein